MVLTWFAVFSAVYGLAAGSALTAAITTVRSTRQKEFATAMFIIGFCCLGAVALTADLTLDLPHDLLIAWADASAL
jgi:small basic protein